MGSFLLNWPRRWHRVAPATEEQTVPDGAQSEPVTFQITGSHQHSMFVPDTLFVSGDCGTSGLLEKIPELRSASCQAQTQGALSVPPREILPTPHAPAATLKVLALAWHECQQLLTSTWKGQAWQ